MKANLLFLLGVVLIVALAGCENAVVMNPSLGNSSLRGNASTVLVQATTGGGIARSDGSQSVFRITDDGAMTLQATDANGTITSTGSRMLALQELQQLRVIVGNIRLLEPQYGRELGNNPAGPGNAGYAEYLLNSGALRTRVDPNVDAAYPPQLLTLRQWLAQQVPTLIPTMAFFCNAQSRSADVCYELYDPVCGGNNRTYANDCFACQDTNVTNYTRGACRQPPSTPPSLPQPPSNPQPPSIPPGNPPRGSPMIGVCGPEDRGDVCTQVYSPVCGNDGNTYSNSCVACSNGNVDTYIPGECGISTGPPPPSGPRSDLTLCTGERPEFCTMEYNPVCAEVDTGIRCIRAPCPSATYKTYGNACSACADEKVYGYRPGSCGPGTPV